MGAHWEARRRFHEEGEPLPERPQPKVENRPEVAQRRAERAKRLSEEQERREQRAAQRRLEIEERKRQREAAQRKTPDLPCELRGSVVGKLICNCRNRPDVYVCGGWEVGKCIMQPTSATMDGPIRYADGTEDKTRYVAESEELPFSEEPLAGIPRLPSCLACPKRKYIQPAEAVPVDPFPRAAPEVLETRLRICQACEQRGLCPMTAALMACALIQCPAGIWPVARLQPERQFAGAAPIVTGALTLETPSWSTGDVGGNSGPTVSQGNEQAEPGNG